MKKIGYMLFAVIYYIACIMPVNRNRYFCVMTHDASNDSSVGVVVNAIRKNNPKAIFSYMRKSDRNKASMLSLFLVKPFALANSGTILLDNEFLPLAYVKIRKNVKVVQLWHGTGTIKKFGHDISEGSMLKLVKKADSRITHLIVNSDYTGKLYQRAFGVTKDKVYITGIPRTDVLFDEDKKAYDIRKFYDEYPNLKEKKLILYAPTFRDDEVNNPKVMLDIDKWVEGTNENSILLLKLHPHVAVAFDDSILKNYDNRVINVSRYEDINTLLFVSDALITDYSSIIFEYILLDRPIYFYAYDLAKFQNDSRGFYEDYEEYVPGVTVNTTDELIKAMNRQDKYGDKRAEFLKSSYKYTDGKSTDRLISLLLDI